MENILDLSYKKIELTGLPKLNQNITEINLEGCGLSEIPKQIFTLPNLKKLNLARNELKNLPETFFNLDKLEEIILTANRITEESINYLNPTSLKKLIINLNYLKKIPEGIKMATTMVTMVLTKTTITIGV